MSTGKSRLELFLEKVQKTESCWLWVAHIDPDPANGGYGTFWDGTRMVKAHRWAFEHFHTAIPNGVLVCHSCDVRHCVNPAHLFLGSSKDNAVDRATKGRGAPQAGELNHRGSKLHAEDVVAIRQQYSAGEHPSAIASRYNISASHARNIGCGRFWGHVK